MSILWFVFPIICAIVATIYLYKKVRVAVVCFATKLSLKTQRVITMVVTLILIVPATRMNMWFIVVLHLIAFLLISDGIILIIKNKKCKKICCSGVIAVALTAIVIGYGSYNMFHVVRTDYTLKTEKNIQIQGYRLILLSDLHYGVSMNDEQLQMVVNRINRENPDIVVLDGDIVDENTTAKQMKSAFHILGMIHNKYGIYYTYGNHDKNNYSASPNYSVKQLAKTIKRNNIQILEDTTALINDEVVLIGRADRGFGNENRQTIFNLTSKLDKKQEWVVLDHQPVDYENVKKAGCDIILSGHTHAGQIWPAGLIDALFHFNELNYGRIQSLNFNAVVTSGIAGWKYPIRTEKHSEYVVLDIMPKKRL